MYKCLWMDCSGMVSLTQKNNVLLFAVEEEKHPRCLIINFSDSKIERKRKLEEKN
jgi:hypothetical protein